MARQLFEPDSDKDQKFWEGMIAPINEARNAANSQTYGAYLGRLRHAASRGDSRPENSFTRLLGLNVPGNEAVRERFQNAVAELFSRVYFGEARDAITRR